MVLIAFLRRLLRALAATPAELVAGIWRIILLLLLFLLFLFRWLWERVCRGEEDENEPPHCDEVPPIIKRKPDPCLYSQFYLQSLGLSVTWDNPDIWITLPDGTPVDSGTLNPNTDYIVNVRIHDASFDPALATEVRCFYRPWSFNTPDRIPIEVLPNGDEKVIVLHIPPWQSEIAQFRWKTPNTPNHHYCLQAECRHPDDKNPNNNLGQENTQIGAGSQGQALRFEANLWNATRQRQAYRIFADAYTIPDGRMTLKLETRERPLVGRRRPFRSISDKMLTRDARGGLMTVAARRLRLTSYAYRGWSSIRDANRRGRSKFPAGWEVRANEERADDGASIEIDAHASTVVPLTITVPADAEPGRKYAFNFSAYNSIGKLVGGVTVHVLVN